MKNITLLKKKTSEDNSSEVSAIELFKEALSEVFFKYLEDNEFVIADMKLFLKTTKKELDTTKKILKENLLTRMNIINQLIKEDKITFEKFIDVSNLPDIEKTNKIPGTFYYDSKNDLWRFCTNKGWKTLNLI